LRHAGILCLIAGVLVQGGCASVGESGRSRLVAPQGIGAAYSEMELQAQLFLAADANCTAGSCDNRPAFRSQVSRLGAKLSQAAQREFPQLRRRIHDFHFQVLAKSDIGVLSSAMGSVAVLDGLRRLETDEPTLAFILAREMGHVIAEHHEENSATSLLVSVAVTLALPVANMLRGAAAAAPATAGGVTTTAATTAASMVGGRALRSVYRPDQLQEADVIGMRLTLQAGYKAEEVIDGLTGLAPRLKDEGWTGELLATKAYLDFALAGPPPPDLSETSVAAIDLSTADR